MVAMGIGRVGLCLDHPHPVGSSVLSSAQIPSRPLMEPYVALAVGFTFVGLVDSIMAGLSDPFRRVLRTCSGFRAVEVMEGWYVQL